MYATIVVSLADMDSSLPFLLRQIRLTQGITQTAMAKHLGIRSTDLCAKEMGRKTMRIDEIESYASFMGYSLTLSLTR